MGPNVADDISLDRQQRAVRRRRGTHTYALITGMRGGEQILRAVLEPFDSSAEAEREPGDQDVLGVDVRLPAEATAEIGDDHAHARSAQAEQLRDRLGELVRSLRRGPQQRPSLAGHGQRPAGLDRQCAVARVLERALNGRGRGCESLVDVTRLDRGVVEHVARIAVHDGGACRQRIVSVRDGG